MYVLVTLPNLPTVSHLFCLTLYASWKSSTTWRSLNTDNRVKGCLRGYRETWKNVKRDFRLFLHAPTVKLDDSIYIINL